MSAVRIAVVGTCASGKTSVVAGLRERGFDAFAVAQEHSIVANLWKHLEPDHLIYLQADLETVRRRRHDADWPEWIYRVQLERLTTSREHAGAVVDTDERSVDDVIDEALRQLELVPPIRH